MKTDLGRACMISGLIVLILLAKAVAQDCGQKGGVHFQAKTDKIIFAPRATMRVKLMVVNIGEVPWYVSRSPAPCSGAAGFATVEILDSNNQIVGDLPCIADMSLLSDDQLLEVVTNPKFWIQLKPGEIYGQEIDARLPAKKGNYRLRARLIPPGFKAEQKEMLSKKGISLLKDACIAPFIPITVK